MIYTNKIEWYMYVAALEKEAFKFCFVRVECDAMTRHNQFKINFMYKYRRLHFGGWLNVYEWIYAGTIYWSWGT